MTDPSDTTPATPAPAAASPPERNRDFLGRIGDKIEDLRSDSPVLNIAFSLGSLFVRQRLENVAARRFRQEDVLSGGIQGINAEAWRPGVSLVRSVRDVDIGPLHGTLNADVGVDFHGFTPGPAGMVSLRIPLGGSRDERPDPQNSNIVQRARNLLGR